MVSFVERAAVAVVAQVRAVEKGAPVRPIGSDHVRSRKPHSQTAEAVSISTGDASTASSAVAARMRATMLASRVGEPDEIGAVHVGTTDLAIGETSNVFALMCRW